MMDAISRSLCLAAALCLAGCEATAPAQYPQGGYPPGQLDPQGAYPPGQLPPQGAYPGGGQLPPGGQWPQGAYPAYPAGPGSPQGAYLPPTNDAINAMDMNVLRATAASVLGELTNALAPAEQAKVRGIPFVPDVKPTEINAYAACDEKNMPRMSITDGLLQIEAYIAQLKATDEVFGTQKLDRYLTALAQTQKPGEPIMPPPAGLIDPAQHTDGRKVMRQQQIFEEQLAFVLGHELAHHYLGHTGCAIGQSGDRAVTPADLLRRASQVAGVVNQPNEVAADWSGVGNLLAAGSRRQGYRWTEQGALLTLDFFARLDKLTVGKLFTAFFDSHPNPTWRVPGVNQAAACFRKTGAACPVPYNLTVLP
jgi:hypothetical protein